MKKNRLIWLASGLALSVGFNACNKKPEAPKQQFISLANMDSTIKPGDNFYNYVNGTWIKKAEIPETESSVGAFLDIYNKTKANVKVILTESATGQHPAGSPEQLVGDFYAAGMDSVTIDKLGHTPIQPFLSQIEKLKSGADVLNFASKGIEDGAASIVGIYAGPDEKRSSHNIAILYQTGLGLPERDYYFKNDPGTQAVVAAYKKYVKTVFVLLGEDSVKAGKNAETIFELEKKLAQSHKTNVEMRDPVANYNKGAVADFQKKYPDFDLKTVLANLEVKTDTVNLSQPAYYEKLGKLLKSEPIDTWQTYLKFQTVDNFAAYLSKPFVDAQFAYNGTALRGQKKMKPRWEQIYSTVDRKVGEALGQLYVKKHFTGESKKRMLELVKNLEKSFEARVNKLDWMSDTTRKTATEKLHAFIEKIGFPDKWRDYSAVKVDKGKYLESVISANQNEYKFQLAKVGKPVDKTEWAMTPPTINAYYNPTFNEIVFPSGILQFPFFDLSADDAINYGAIGMVIGHEITHGFDDQGSQYDKDGNIKNWWGKSDAEKFKKKGEQVIALYNTYTVLDTCHVKGALTLGENMADIGGIAIAYDAFKMTPQGQSQEKIDGFTPDQRFFIAFAQGWRTKQKEETQRTRINTDPHSPPLYRVNGPLSNFTPFYTAFNVKEGDKMFKPEAERITIW